MELDKIEMLLKKYDAAQTTLAEERALQAYFESGEVAPQHRPYQVMFSFSTFSRKEITTVAPKLDQDRPKSKLRPQSWMYAAAMIALILSIFFFRNQDSQVKSGNIGQLTKEEIAYQQTKEALQMVSKYMNEGKEDLKYLKEFNKTANKIIKTK